MNNIQGGGHPADYPPESRGIATTPVSADVLPPMRDHPLSMPPMHHPAVARGMSWNPEDRPPPPPPDGNLRAQPLHENRNGGPHQTHMNHLEMLLSRQLHLMRTVTDKMHEKEQNEIVKEEWKASARVINFIFVTLFFFLVILAPLLIFLGIPELISSSVDVSLLTMTEHQLGCTW